MLESFPLSQQFLKITKKCPERVKNFYVLHVGKTIQPYQKTQNKKKTQKPLASSCMLFSQQHVVYALTLLIPVVLAKGCPPFQYDPKTYSFAANKKSGFYELTCLKFLYQPSCKNSKCEKDEVAGKFTCSKREKSWLTEDGMRDSASLAGQFPKCQPLTCPVGARVKTGKVKTAQLGDKGLGSFGFLGEMRCSTCIFLQTAEPHPNPFPTNTSKSPSPPPNIAPI